MSPNYRVRVQQGRPDLPRTADVARILHTAHHDPHKAEEQERGKHYAENRELAPARPALLRAIPDLYVERVSPNQSATIHGENWLLRTTLNGRGAGLGRASEGGQAEAQVLDKPRTQRSRL